MVTALRYVDSLETAREEVLALHARTPVFASATERCFQEDPMLVESEEGDRLCVCAPPVGHVCSECRDEDGSSRSWPCPTVELLH